MQIIHERETHKKNKTQKNKGGGDRNYSERVRPTMFCCAFKLGFLQSVFKASLIFNSDLQLVL